MKHLIILLITIVLFSCKKNTLDNTTEPAPSPVEKTIKPDTILKGSVQETKQKISFDIDYIKSKTTSLSKTIDLKQIDPNNLDSIPKEFITNYLTPHKITIGYPEHLPNEYSKEYRFSQFKAYQDFNLFTFTHRNETCCITLYAATIAKNDLKVIDMCTLGYEGGDGGWYGHNSGTWTTDYLINTMEVSNYDEDFTEDVNQMEIDTTWAEIRLNDKGTFEHKELRKVAYKNGQLVE